jgi:hypothetical protein
VLGSKVRGRRRFVLRGEEIRGILGSERGREEEEEIRGSNKNSGYLTSVFQEV